MFKHVLIPADGSPIALKAAKAARVPFASLVAKAATHAHRAQRALCGGAHGTCG